MGKSVRKIPTFAEVMEEKPRKVPTYDEVMKTSAPKMKGGVVFEEPLPPEEDIISLSRRAEELGKKTIETPVLGGELGTNQPISELDPEAQKESTKLKKQVKDRGYNTTELATEFEGFPQVELDKPGKKEELLNLRKSNPIEYRMQLNAAKNQYDVLESVKNNIYNSLPANDPYREVKASQAGVHAANEFNDLNIQDGDSLNDKYDKIIGKIRIIDENVPVEQREKMLGRLQEDAAQHISATSKQLKDELTNSEWNGKLDASQYAGLKTLELFQPEKYKQAVRVLGVKSPEPDNVFLDPDLDPSEFGEAAPYVESKKESTINQAKGAEAVRKELADIGRANSIKSIHRKQYTLDQAYQNASEEEKPLIAAQYVQYENVLKNLGEDARKDDERYPLLAQMKFDEQVKEIMQDPGFGALGYGAKRFGKGFKSSVNSLENILTNTFGSKESKEQLEMERLGGGKTDQNEFYLPESYRSTGSAIVPRFSKELSDEVKAIYNDASLSMKEREKKAIGVVSRNQDKADWVTNTEAGRQRNFLSKATMYGNAGMIGDIASVAAQTLALGGAGVGRLASAAIPMFSTTQDDFYKQAVAEGNPNPMSYANTHAGIMALAGMINPDIKILRNALGVNTPAGKFIAGVSDETWNKVVSKNPQLLAKFSNAAKSVAKEAGKITAVYGAGTSIANDLADKGFGGKDISADEIMDRAVEATKHTALNSVALFGLGAVRNFKTASPLEKANIWEAGTNVDITLKQLEEAATRGEITPEQAKTYSESAKEISKLIDEVPTTNAKGKPLTDKQRIDYLYNKLTATKAKELKQGATEGKTEELDTITQQADGDNNKIVSGYMRKTPSQESVEAKEKDAKLFVDELKEGEIINDVEYAAAKDNPMQYFETVAQQANNVTADKVFDTATDARKAAKSKYGDSVIDYANELFPEYKEIASQKPKHTVSTPNVVNVKLKDNSLNDFGGIKVNVPSMVDFVKRFISDEGINEIKSANVSDLVKIKKMQENAPQEEGVESVSTIKTEGLKEPLVLIRDKEGNMRLQQGHHRLEEAIKLGATKLPVVVVEAPKQRAGEKDAETGEIMGENLSNALPIKLEHFKPEATVPPKPIETTEGQGEEIRLSHSDTKKIYEEAGLPQRLETPNKEDKVTLEAADKLVKDGYNFDKEAEKVMKGEKNSFTDEEQVAFAKAVAAMKAKQEGLDIKSPEFEALQDKIEKYSRASDVVGTLEGRAFRARQLFVPKEDSLSDFVMREKEVNKDAPLTDQQKETVQKEYTEITEAQKKYDEKIAALEAENARLRAEKSLPKKSTQKTKKTHDDFVTERKQIFTDIKEKLRKARGESQATIVPYAKELIAISPDVAKLVKNLVEEGVTKLADVVKEVHANLKEAIPEITEKDVNDLIAGEYNPKKPTRDQLSEKVRDLKDEAKLINKLQKILDGEEPKEEKAKIKRNQEIEELRGKIKEALGDGKTPEKAKLDAYKKKTEKQIDNILYKLKTGDFDSEGVKKEPLKLDEEAQRMQDALIQLKKERELRLLSREYQNSSKWNKIQKGAVNVLGVPRTLMASMDYSAPLRQALLPTISHPIMASKAAVEMFKASFSQKNYDRWFSNLEHSPRYELMKESKLAITDVNNPKLSVHEEQYMNQLAEKVPIIGQTLKVKGGTVIPGINAIKRSERAYTIYLNKMRVDLFNRFADQMQKDGRTFKNSPEQYKQMAAFVNNMTGRGDLGEALNKAAPVLNQLFFSPRLMASRANTLTYLAQPRFWKKAPPEVRKDYFRSLLTTAGLGLTVLGMAKLAGADTEDDPRSPDFGKIKSGNTRWDIWGGHQQYIRVAAQMLTGERKSSTSGEISKLDGEGPFGTTRGDVGLAFMRGKLAPVPSMMVDIGTRRTTTGDKLTTDWGSDKAERKVGVGEYLANHFLPLTSTGLYDALKDQGQKAWFTVGVPSVFGVGTQTYETKPQSSKSKPKSKSKKKKKAD